MCPEVLFFSSITKCADRNGMPFYKVITIIAATENHDGQYLCFLSRAQYEHFCRVNNLRDTR